jgi:hypothetical protein
MNRYVITDGVKSIDLPQYPNEAWHFYGEDDEDGKEDFYATVAAVFRAVNLTANATANIPFALVKKPGKDYDISTEWENKVGFLPKPQELIRLWRMSLSMSNMAYGFMENSRKDGRNLKYIVPTTISPNVDINGLHGFKRTLGTSSKDYDISPKSIVDPAHPIFWMWRMDHTTELLPAKATEFQAMCAAAGILYYSDYFVSAFFKRGGIKPTMLILKGMTTKDNIDKIESVWDKIIRGGYKYLGKIFQGVDAAGGLEALPIGEGVDTLKDQNLTKSKIEDIAMSIGMPLSLLLANSANYATAQVEYKTWYENSLGPWCDFMAEEMTDKLFKPLNLRFEFRPEMTDPGQEDEVSRAGAYSTYVTSGMKPSVAAQVVGIELPEGIEYDALDMMQEEKQQQAIEIMQQKQGTSDNDDKKPVDKKGWVTINGNHVLIGEEENNGNVASTQQAIEIIKMQSFGAPPAHIEAYLKENGIDYVEVYHITNTSSVERLEKEGIRMSSQDNRPDASYFFLDKSDIAANAEILGYPKYSIVTIRIPRQYAANIRDDGLFNGTFSSSYSAARLLQPIPADWIIKSPSKAKFIPNIDQLHELELWRKFAFRKFKKGEPLSFAFEVKTLPDEIAEDIRCGLEVAESEDAIKAAFDIDDVPIVENKSDLAILELADAINKACENVTAPA